MNTYGYFLPAVCEGGNQPAAVHCWVIVAYSMTSVHVLPGEVGVVGGRVMDS